MDTKKLTIGILVIIAIVFAALSFRTKDTVVVNKDGTVTTLGSVSSPDIMSPYFSVGGVYQWKNARTLGTATTTMCSVQSPSATSTLDSARLQITTGTSTATIFTVATSTTAFATTTALNRFSLASAAQGSFALMSTTSDAYRIMSPNTWVVWSVEGTVISDATKLLGTCNTTFTTF